jgi:hypothetical protein
MPAVDFYLLSAARRAHRLKPEKRSYVIGREDGVDLVIQDALASRRHAEIRFADEGFWFVLDLNSRNGVFVNGQRMSQPTRLDDGTQLQVGGQVFRMHLLPPGGDPASLGQQAPQISTQETMGPGMAMGDLASQGATFTGQVTGGLMDLVQFFVTTGKTGRLDLIGTSQIPASVWMQAGMPVHAVLPVPGKGFVEGFDALAALAKAPPPRFAFHADAPPADRTTITGSPSGVLMELARLMDEGTR